MPRWHLLILVSGLSGAWPVRTAAGQAPGGRLVLGGGEYVHLELRQQFVDMAGGPAKRIVYIPTASSGIRLPSGFEYEPTDADTANPRDSQFAAELAQLFGVKAVEIVHTRSRETASSEEFLARLERADGIWFSGGNAGRLADAYLGTRAQIAFQRALARGAVIGGNSAGAIIQGSFIVRGRPDKPVLMAPGRTDGFGFLPGVVINPHLLSQKRENELVSVLDAHPDLLGFGISDSAGIVVRGDTALVVGEGRVAVYDNEKHGCCWYFWIKPGDRFDLRLRRPIPP